MGRSTIKQIPLCKETISENCNGISVKRWSDKNLQSWKLVPQKELLWSPAQNPSADEFENKILPSLSQYKNICRSTSKDHNGNAGIFVCKEKKENRTIVASPPPVLPVPPVLPAPPTPPPAPPVTPLPLPKPASAIEEKNNSIKLEALKKRLEEEAQKKLSQEMKKLEEAHKKEREEYEKKIRRLQTAREKKPKKKKEDLKMTIAIGATGAITGGLLGIGTVAGLRRLRARNEPQGPESPRAINLSPPPSTLTEPKPIQITEETILKVLLSEGPVGLMMLEEEKRERLIKGVQRIWEANPELQKMFPLDSDGIPPKKFIAVALAVLDGDELRLAHLAGDNLLEGLITDKALEQERLFQSQRQSEQLELFEPKRRPSPTPPPAPPGPPSPPVGEAENISAESAMRLLTEMEMLELVTDDTIEIPVDQVPTGTGEGPVIELTDVINNPRVDSLLEPAQVAQQLAELLARSTEPIPTSKIPELIEYARRISGIWNKNQGLRRKFPMENKKLNPAFLKMALAILRRDETTLVRLAENDPDLVGLIRRARMLEEGQIGLRGSRGGRSGNNSGATTVGTLTGADLLAEGAPKLRHAVRVLIEGGRRALEPFGGFAPLAGIFGAKTTAEHFGYLQPQQSALVNTAATSAFFIADAGFSATMIGGTPGAIAGHWGATRLAKATGVAGLQEGELGNKLAGVGGGLAGFGVSLWTANKFEGFRNFHAATTEGTKHLARQIVSSAGAVGMRIEEGLKNMVPAGIGAMVATGLATAKAGVAVAGEVVLASAAATTAVVVGEGIALGAWIHYSGAGKLIGTDQLGESIVDDWMKTFNW